MVWPVVVVLCGCGGIEVVVAWLVIVGVLCAPALCNVTALSVAPVANAVASAAQILHFVCSTPPNYISVPYHHDVLAATLPQMHRPHVCCEAALPTECPATAIVVTRGCAPSDAQTPHALSGAPWY